jgi:hypothetical protein
LLPGCRRPERRSAHVTPGTRGHKNPCPDPVEPFAFLEDELLPLALAPVEPTAFVLSCVQAAWGPHGPKN